LAIFGDLWRSGVRGKPRQRFNAIETASESDRNDLLRQLDDAPSEGLARSTGPIFWPGAAPPPRRHSVTPLAPHGLRAIRVPEALATKKSPPPDYRQAGARQFQSARRRAVLRDAASGLESNRLDQVMITKPFTAREEDFWNESAGLAFL